jgi:hypothetical protein
MSETRSIWSRPLARTAALALLSVFIAAPTPGNVGGCGSDAASSPVQPSPPNSAEYVYFDQGLCSSFCLRLLECGVLCDSVQNRPENCGPGNDTALREAFRECVRGQLRRDFFGVDSCPHSCAGLGTFRQAYEWDVQVCSDTILTRSCEPGHFEGNEFVAPPGSIGGTFSEVPGECVNVCR